MVECSRTGGITTSNGWKPSPRPCKAVPPARCATCCPGLHPAETADLLESLPHGPRELLWELVAPEDQGEVLIELNEEVRTGLIEQMETHQLIEVTEGLDTDDLADLLVNLPGTVDSRTAALHGPAKPPAAGSGAAATPRTPPAD